ncbi:uncharacterized protein (TIGR01619 family) [Mesocricetibacter intestinalis]|uniref:Uncharacterized protein (TIGR01619 family) n=1 Tax=Mesocricetibacter intestinalis TaxID=1521930 RepID=A0A4R6VAV4_9PAST|nr:TIGR01619 family protein [Mesocricetibacter intestinalis]TDQ59097.1 uncharacterized protein (TIGR01619 family) [Mesocricetibacter intestinalis]
MEQKQNWHTYRSSINGKNAVVSVNMALFEQFPTESHSFVMQFSVPYAADKEGLPLPEAYPALQNAIFKALTQLCALPETLYAGHIICDKRAILYFYTEEIMTFGQILLQSGYHSDLDVQEDPNWDLYFDFLLPSSLETKINATEDVLKLLEQDGRDLSDIYTLEHSFYFPTKESLFDFIEHTDLERLAFNTLRYTDERVQIDEEREVYIAKLEHETSLDKQDLFGLIENLEQLAARYSGQYAGWTCEDFIPAKNSLMN